MSDKTTVKLEGKALELALEINARRIAALKALDEAKATANKAESDMWDMLKEHVPEYKADEEGNWSVDVEYAAQGNVFIKKEDMPQMPTELKALMSALRGVN